MITPDGSYPLVQSLSVAGSSYQVTRQYEAHRDLPTEIKSQGSGGVYTQFDYVYNALRQRTSAQEAGTAFQDTYSPGTGYSSVTNAYTYDSLGQLSNATMSTGAPGGGSAIPGHSYSYWYDSAGNRTQAGPSATLNNGGNDTYQANNLNQYSQKRTNSVRIVGDAQVGATVTTSVASTSQLDRNFAALASVPSSGSATYNPVTVTATVSGQPSRTILRDYLLAPQPEAFAYDADGNLTSDGLWTYTYDAENRLVAMQSVLSGLGNTPYELTFAYDYLGRRVEKKVYQSPGQLTFDHRYLYDGSNLVAAEEALRSQWGQPIPEKMLQRVLA